MTWQSILLVALSALLILVWLPWLIISTRKTLREGRPRRRSGRETESRNKKTK